ncbi:MAG: glycine cleavage system protein GcvH [Nitrospiraceae bacterium]|nr:glycine cleavage system protein GcvH [Nitrospiraceae bacterium]
MDPALLRYTEEHEWIGEEDSVLVVGITDFAQEQLGDITYVELPEVGRTVAKGETVVMVESVKAASDIRAPAGGTVCATNGALEEQPELINQNAYGTGWFFKLKSANPEELGNLMDADAYRRFLDANED